MTTSLELLLTTAFIAVVSAGLSTVVGVPLGFWISRLPRRIARTVSVLVTIPFLLPPFLVGISVSTWTTSLDINAANGMLLILLAHSIMNAGFIARVVSAKTLESEQVEAAMLDGAKPGQIRRHILIPQLLPSLGSAALLVALYSSTSYGLVLTLADGTVATLETEIALSALRDLDLQRAALLALLQTLLTLGLFVWERSFISLPASISEIQKSPLPAGRTSTFVGVLFSVLVFAVLLGIMVRSNWGSGLATNLENLGSRGTRSMLNISVVEAAGNSIRNAIVVLVIALPLAWVMAKKPGRLSPLLPAGISPVVMGLVTLAVAGYLPRELTSSWVLLPLVQVLFALPIAYQILQPARSSIDKEQLQAASLDGAGSLRSSWFIELPQLRKSIAIAAAFIMLTSLGEFGAASFLAFGSNETLPIVLFQLAGRPGGDNYGMVMVTAAIYILLTAFILWLLTSPVQIQRRSRSAV